MDGTHIKDNKVNLKLRKTPSKHYFFFIWEKTSVVNSVVEHLRPAHEYQCFMGA
jgi:hypothetical protein